MSVSDRCAPVTLWLFERSALFRYVVLMVLKHDWPRCAVEHFVRATPVIARLEELVRLGELRDGLQWRR